MQSCLLYKLGFCIYGFQSVEWNYFGFRNWFWLFWRKECEYDLNYPFKNPILRAGISDRFLISFPKLGVFNTSHKEFFSKKKRRSYLKAYVCVNLLRVYMALLYDSLLQRFWKKIVSIYTAPKRIGSKSRTCCIALNEKGFLPVIC